MKTKDTPKKEPTKINKEEFEELISNFAESEEILYYYNGDKEALKSFCLETYGLNYRLAYNKLLAKAKIELRKKLYKVATNGEEHISKSQLIMLVWLSKGYLKLRENTPIGEEQKICGSNGEFKGIPKKKDFSELWNEDTEADY